MNSLSLAYMEDASPNTSEQINVLKKELESIRSQVTRGAILRAKAKWTEEGEKNSAYFLSLEKHNVENKSISEIKIDTNVHITD